MRDPVAQLRPEAGRVGAEARGTCPSFHGDAPRDVRPARRARAPAGWMPAHTSTNGWPVISTSASRTLARQAGLLRPGDEVVEEDPEAPLRRRAGTSATAAGEVVDAVHRLDDDAELAEVVAPHVLDAARRRGGPRPRSGSPRRPAAGAGVPAIEPDAVTVGADGADGRRAAQRHRPALEQEPAGLPREVAPVLRAVAQRDGLDAPRHDVAAEPAGAVLDDHPDGDVDLAGSATGRRASAQLVEDVAFVGHGRSDSSTGTSADRGTSDRHGEPHHDHITVRAAAVAAIAGTLGLDRLPRRRRRRRIARPRRPRRHRRRRRRRRRRPAPRGRPARVGERGAAPTPRRRAGRRRRPTMQVPGQAIAIEARATLRGRRRPRRGRPDHLDGHDARRRVSPPPTSTTRPPAEDGGGRRRPRHARRWRSRPASCRRVADALEELGTVLSLRPAGRGRHRPARRPRHAHRQHAGQRRAGARALRRGRPTSTASCASRPS